MYSIFAIVKQESLKVNLSFHDQSKLHAEKYMVVDDQTCGIGHIQTGKIMYSNLVGSSERGMGTAPLTCDR